ncbi:hypothetical protein AAFO90_16475 [Phaeobacter sp. CAU 1743]|uniref:hypothetical protein n=1 Tax=Phaeobacter sp. CAU 1743 TaxID=3140367 RepID=UPI00325A73D9
MALPSRQALYSVAQDMQSRDVFEQANLLQQLGGRVFPASTHASDRFDYDAMQWHVSLLGIIGRGPDLADALADWLKTAGLYHRTDDTRRATDGRPDCPYNGQAPLPETLPDAEARNLPKHRLAGGAAPGPF